MEGRGQLLQQCNNFLYAWKRSLLDYYRQLFDTSSAFGTIVQIYKRWSMI